MELHNEKAARATSVVQFVETCSSSVSLEVGEYQKAMQDLHALQFGYQDVQMFLFKPELTVLVNLLGLHYCINWLGVPVYTFITLSTDQLSVGIYVSKLFIFLRIASILCCWPYIEYSVIALEELHRLLSLF